MLKIDIPGFKDLSIEKIVFDYNGTLALQGEIKPEILKKLKELAGYFEVYVVTADTYGTVRQTFAGSSVRVKIISGSQGRKEKEDFVKSLNSREVLAVGNGRNDTAMLQEAALGIAVLEGEGMAAELYGSTDLICPGIAEVFALLENPRSLKASLRG